MNVAYDLSPGSIVLGGQTTPIISFERMVIREGAFVLLAGATGAGKTLFLSLLSGLKLRTQGVQIECTINLYGRRIGEYSDRERAERIGFVGPDPNLEILHHSLEEELAFLPRNLGFDERQVSRRVREVVNVLGLAPYEGRTLSKLSEGEKQRVALGAVLTGYPKILLLDQPTALLSSAAAESFISLLALLNRSFGHTVIIAEQNWDAVSPYVSEVLTFCDKVVELCADVPSAVRLLSRRQEGLCSPRQRKLLAKASIHREEAEEVSSFRALPSLGSIEKTEYSNNNETSSLSRQSESIQTKVLSVSSLFYKYPGKGEQNHVLKDLSFELRSGQIVGVIGENGAGKTTLLGLLSGQLKPQDGSIRLHGHSRLRGKRAELKRCYLPTRSDLTLLHSRVDEELGFLLEPATDEAGDFNEDILHRLELRSLFGQSRQDLSTGQRQRVALAAALCEVPDILLCDEPTRSLDYSLKTKIGKLLQVLSRRGMAVVFSTHDLDFAAEFATEILVLDRGQILDQGNTDEVLRRSSFTQPWSWRALSPGASFWPGIKAEQEEYGR